MADEPVATKEKDTFEVPEQTSTVAPVAPSRTEVKDKGWTKAEMDSAEKRGMIISPEEKEKADAAAAKAKTDADAKAKVEADAAAAAKGGVPAPDPKLIPGVDVTLTPEQEKVFLATFPPGTSHRALYFRAKNERMARQKEQAGREAAEKHATELENRIKVLEAAGKTTEEMDELGNPIDPEDKPMTLKQLLALQKKQEEIDTRARNLVEAQKTQEEYAKSLYSDFDATVGLAKDLINNLEALVPERWKQTKIIKMIRDLQISSANADKIDLDEYHASIIAYELGQMHPKYGQPAEPDPANNGDASEDGKKPDPTKANGSRLTPEQMKRIEKNTQRGVSSASVSGGGGKRVISSEDVDLLTLNRMTYAERQRFRAKHPDQYTKLLRG